MGHGVARTEINTMTIREELERIRKKHGGILHPEDVVKAAEPKTSPLHDRFDWDDSVAAKKWRINQARHLIQVFVTVTKTSEKEISSRMFVSLNVDRKDQGGYRVLSEVLNDDRLRSFLLIDALTELESFKQKYKNLVELSKVFEEIDNVQAGVARSVTVR